MTPTLVPDGPGAPPAGPDDDGRAPAALLGVLARRSQGAAGRAELTAALIGHRLLVPLLEVAAAELPAGEDPCAGADRAMAVVTMVDPEGGTVGLAFSGVEQMGRWNPRARPLPRPAPAVAESVIAAGGRRLLVDPGQPGVVEVSGLALLRLARSEPWPPPWADPYVQQAVTQELTDLVASGTAIRLEAPQQTSGADLLIRLRGQADPHEVAARLAASPLLTATFDGVLAVDQTK